LNKHFNDMSPRDAGIRLAPTTTEFVLGALVAPTPSQYCHQNKKAKAAHRRLM
jgi:hypothetical protein